MTTTDLAQQLHQRISDGVAALAEDRQWVALLDLAARTGSRYSLGNTLLIGAQRPDAICVAGYGSWRKAGRQVRRGERGLRILAPIVRRPPRPETHADPAPAAGAPTDDPGLHPARHPTAQPGELNGRGTRQSGKIAGFRSVVVFDIAQTDGPPLPGGTTIDGYTPDGLRDALTAQINQHGYQVRIGDCRPAFGITRRSDRTVTILPDQPAAQDALTLAHELGHLACGHLADDSGHTHHGTLEVEAESVAYILVTAAGMDTAAASFDYIGTWAGGDAELLRATADKVIRTARGLLASLGLNATPIAASDDD